MISEEHVEELAKTVWGGWETRYESHRQEARREARLYLEAIHANPSISGFQTMTVSEARLHPWLGISDGVPWLVIPDPPKCDAIYTPSLDEVIADWLFRTTHRYEQVAGDTEAALTQDVRCATCRHWAAAESADRQYGWCGTADVEVMSFGEARGDLRTYPDHACSMWEPQP